MLCLFLGECGSASDLIKVQLLEAGRANFLVILLRRRFSAIWNTDDGGR